MKSCIKFQQVKWVLFTSTWLQQNAYNCTRLLWYHIDIEDSSIRIEYIDQD